MGIIGITPGYICHAVSVFETPSLVLIVIVSTSPTCGLNASHWVANERQPPPPAVVGHNQNIDAVVDRKFPNDLYFVSIFSNKIGHKPFDSSSGDLYFWCRMKFVADSIQTQTPQLMDLGFSDINALDEISGLSTPAIIIRRPTGGSHWSAPDHIFLKQQQ